MPPLLRVALLMALIGAGASPAAAPSRPPPARPVMAMAATEAAPDPRQPSAKVLGWNSASGGIGCEARPSATAKRIIAAISSRLRVKP